MNQKRNTFDIVLRFGFPIDLELSPGCYLSLIHFFRASSWSLDTIRSHWFSAVKEYSPLCKEGNFHVLVGDGGRQSKEGRRMPGVKKLFQESENSAWSILLSFLVKAYAKTERLPENRGSWPLRAGERGKKQFRNNRIIQEPTGILWLHPHNFRLFVPCSFLINGNLRISTNLNQT